MTETEQNALTDEYAALLVAIQGIHAKIEAALLSRSATPRRIQVVCAVHDRLLDAAKYIEANL